MNISKINTFVNDQPFEIFMKANVITVTNEITTRFPDCKSSWKIKPNTYPTTKPVKILKIRVAMLIEVF